MMESNGITIGSTWFVNRFALYNKSPKSLSPRSIFQTDGNLMLKPYLAQPLLTVPAFALWNMPAIWPNVSRRNFLIRSPCSEAHSAACAAPSK